MLLPPELQYPLTVVPSGPYNWVVYGHPKYPHGLRCPDRPTHKDSLANIFLGMNSIEEVQREVEFYGSLTALPYPQHPDKAKVVGSKIYVGDSASVRTIRIAITKARRPKSIHRVKRPTDSRCKFIVSHGHRYGGNLRVGCERDAINAKETLKPFLSALRECDDVRRAQQILDKGVPK